MEISRKDDLKVLGTVQEYIGKKGSIAFLDTNLAGEARVMVDITNEAGVTIECLLSTPLSKLLRDKQIKAGNLITLEYGVNSLGRHYIVRPKGTKHTISAEKLKAEKLETKVIDINDYIAF